MIAACVEHVIVRILPLELQQALHPKVKHTTFKFKNRHASMVVNSSEASRNLYGNGRAYGTATNPARPLAVISAGTTALIFQHFYNAKIFLEAANSKLEETYNKMADVNGAFAGLTSCPKITCGLVSGWTEMPRQFAELEHNPHLVFATLGRILDLLDRRNLSSCICFLDDVQLYMQDGSSSDEQWYEQMVEKVDAN